MGTVFAFYKNLNNKSHLLRENTHYILKKLIASCFILLSGFFLSAQTPVANFTGSPLSGCSPLVVNFQDQSTGNPTSWSWDFGNGNTSVLQNPSASYFTPGTYTVRLTATNANGSNTITKTQYITVYEPPAVDFSSNNRSGCFPLRVLFTDLSTAGSGNTNVLWNWDFGNGTTSTLQNPQTVYTSAGSFSVTLRVTNDKGCSRTISRPNYITVTNGVTAGFTNTQPTVCSAPAAINFTNTSTGPPTLSYIWDFGDGNFSPLPNPSHTYTANGTYTVTLVTSSTAGCVDTFRSNPIVIGGFTTSFSSPLSVCINQTVNFTNTSTPAPVSSNWTFGDGGTANIINATHAYVATGSYTVWLYNTYSSCTDSISQTITVNPRPVADFSAPVTTRCEPPLTVNFQDLSTGGATAWQWDFGDGNTSTLQNPSHTYSAYGNFTVTLIATNGFGCTDTIVRPNFVRIQRASISIPALPASGCIPYTITMIPTIVSLDAVTSYNWDFGDGGTSTLPNPTYTYIAQGTYTVRLIITTSSGCTDTLTLPNAVRVGSKPTADFSAFPIPVCGRQPVYFTNLTTPASDQWNWDFGDGGTSTLQNPSHSYNDTGYFNIRLIATNNGCPDTIIKTNYVRVLPPIARFTPVPDCSNRLRFSFTDQSIAPLTWEWDFGDGSPVSTIQNPVHIFPALGPYSVRLIVTNGGCADTLTLNITTVDENPDFGADRTAACKIATINFTATNINIANLTNYAWDFGDGGTGNSASPTISHNYTASGTYSVTLTTTDINGCTDVVTRTNYIRINGAIANFSATNVGGCAGLTTTFNDLSTTDGVNPITNWQWNFGDGSTQNFSGPPYQHTYNTPGTFSVQLIVTDAAGCEDSITLNNLITATDPIPNFTSADTLTCPGATVTFNNTSTPAGFSSTWDFGDGGTSALASPTHIYAATGTYTVKLIIQDTYNCIDSIIKNTFIRVDIPRADFDVSDSISSCLPLEVQFTNLSTYYSSVVWDFGPGEGTSLLNNPVHYYNTPGVYPVKLLVTSPGGCVDSVFKNITINDTTGSRLNYIPLNGCSPLIANFNIITSGQMASFFWDFGDGYTTTTTTTSVSHTYTSFGVFIPRVIMQDPSGCLIPLQGIDTFNITGAIANFGIDTAFFCDRGTVNFQDSTTFNDPIQTYNWSFGDGGTSTQQNPSHTYNSPGIYSVQLAVQTQMGCRDTIIKNALVKIVQRPLIDIGGDSVLCINSSLIHTGIFIQPDTSVVNWQWNFPNGNTSVLQNPPTQTYTAAGTFNVTAIATNSSGCKDTTIQTIYVNPLPVINIPSQMTIQNGFPLVIPATYSPNTVNWIWSPSAGLSCTNCPSPLAGPKFKTLYQVYFTDSNGCSNTGSILVNVFCNNVNLFIPNTFSPNGDGSNDIFYPRGKGLERIKLLRIFNRWGEVVFERKDFQVNNPLFGWDGTYKGKKQQADVYVYQAEVFCENGQIITLNGNIALIL
ncbi:MAG: PKD domain-containing protein [Sphingobacteriales bacterium]|nr:PKD domain-containing protein [Sphingobacteriales bacterium]